MKHDEKHVDLAITFATKKQIEAWLDIKVLAETFPPILLGLDSDSNRVYAEDITHRFGVHIYSGIQNIAKILGVELTETTHDSKFNKLYFMYKDMEVFQLEEIKNDAD